jgi:hypothetical protein
MGQSACGRHPRKARQQYAHSIRHHTCSLVSRSVVVVLVVGSLPSATFGLPRLLGRLLPRLLVFPCPPFPLLRCGLVADCGQYCQCQSAKHCCFSPGQAHSGCPICSYVRRVPIGAPFINRSDVYRDPSSVNHPADAEHRLHDAADSVEKLGYASSV